MGGLLAGIGKAIMGGIGQMAGGGGGGEGGGGGGEILKGVGDLVTGIIDATKGGGGAGEAKEAAPAAAAPEKKDPLAQLQAALDKAKTPEEVDALVAKLGEKLGKNGDPKIQQAVAMMAKEKRLELAAATI
jgi:hypothetical protein